MEQIHLETHKQNNKYQTKGLAVVVSGIVIGFLNVIDIEEGSWTLIRWSREGYSVNTVARWWVSELMKLPTKFIKIRRYHRYRAATSQFRFESIVPHLDHFDSSKTYYKFISERRTLKGECVYSWSLLLYYINSVLLPTGGLLISREQASHQTNLIWCIGKGCRVTVCIEL